MSTNNGWNTYWNQTGPIARAISVGRGMLARELFQYLAQQVTPSRARPATIEVGCGCATVSALMADQGWFSVALDIERAALQAARQLSPRVHLVQGDFFRGSFRENSFDLVWNNSTIEHFWEPLVALKKMSELARPKGKMFVGVPYTFGPLCVFKLRKRSFGGTWDGTTFSGRQLRQMFQRIGLHVLDQRLFFMGCFVGVIGQRP